MRDMVLVEATTRFVVRRVQVHELPKLGVFKEMLCSTICRFTVWRLEVLCSTICRLTVWRFAHLFTICSEGSGVLKHFHASCFSLFGLRPICQDFDLRTSRLPGRSEAEAPVCLHRQGRSKKQRIGALSASSATHGAEKESFILSILLSFVHITALAIRAHKADHLSSRA